MTSLRTSIAAAIAAIVLFALAVALEVRIEPPRARVTWNGSVTDPAAAARDLRLVDARRVDSATPSGPQVFVYRVLDPSTKRLDELRADPRVASLAGVDAAEPRERVRVRWRQPADWREAAQVQSAGMLAVALIVFACSTAARRRTRRLGALASCIMLAMFAWTQPLDQRIRMGDIETYAASRDGFERYIASHSTMRFEAHLSALVLRTIDRRLGSDDRSPMQAFRVLGRIAGLWFVAMLAVAAWAGGWSPAALRYVAVAAALPSALLYCGYRELGHLSLNPAVIPLMVAGLRGRRGRLEGASVLAGIGAALHGFGVLSLAGLACATVFGSIRTADRARALATTVAFGTAAYLGWVFIYVVVMHLSVVPGHAEGVLLRPLLRPALAEQRVNEALVSLRGAREAVIAAWIAGLPLVLPAIASAAKLRLRAAPAFMYAVPSALFVVAFWPIQGVGVEADLVAAAFPGAYALAWVASRWRRATWVALALAASAHIVFWRAVLGDIFVNPRVY